ncbi:MAG: 3-dehydroquinate synthase [Planctomycetes bacterium]|nr:3-dehydroquinate synthase [Planctomycetota bacterium]
MGKQNDLNQNKKFEFEVRVPTDYHYNVIYKVDLLKEYGSLLVREMGKTAIAILTDNRVNKLYGETLIRSFLEEGIEPDLLIVQEGEPSKSMDTFASLLDQLADLKFNRRGILVNFGGGVVTDLGGYVASSYMRGIAYTNFGTSLLAQLDSCVGGKVAVNAKVAKNMIGAFYHPRHVAGDPVLLKTLSFRDFKSGLAEAIKVAVIMSPELFDLLETEHARIMKREPEIMVKVIGLASKLKMDMISLDPYENDLRRPLNFGHTIGHPIETEFAYKNIRHGEAVGIGMGVATVVALNKGIIPEETAERIYDMLLAYDLLGFSEPINPDNVIEHVKYVRLIRANQLNFVLPTKKIGEVLITNEVSDTDLVKGFEDYEGVVCRKKGKE